MNKIKEARINAGLTQEEVFKLLGIPVRTLQNWESEKRIPPKYVEVLVLEKLEKLKK